MTIKHVITEAIDALNAAHMAEASALEALRLASTEVDRLEERFLDAAIRAAVEAADARTVQLLAETITRYDIIAEGLTVSAAMVTEESDQRAIVNALDALDQMREIIDSVDSAVSTDG